MESGGVTVLIMAAGTGGHVFPALSIAETLRARSVQVEWLGTPKGMENELLAETDIPLHRVSVKGLRGAGALRILTAPFMLLLAFIESYRVLRRVNPDCVIGMGGFVCGPAGLACWLQRRPLLIHEQNAVAGLTNRLLARFATRVFEAFPNTFKQQAKVEHTGNPLRAKITELAATAKAQPLVGDQLNLLVLGGSQGALAINQLIPELIAHYQGSSQLQTLHQTGSRGFASTVALYESAGVSVGETHRVLPFIDDMPAAYAWADVVICRSGASTVSEIAAVGLPAIFVPYPYHKDQQQTHNANWLVNAEAAFIIQQADLSLHTLAAQLQEFDSDRDFLTRTSSNARGKAILDADQRIVDACLEVLDA
ncbi:MAG: undecaprenyldiphospho-muramoylpentapeptide beta-N-acetylglucosaminyltransferase [Pseudomonadales bacterium]|nr:undecaprenyldiphospho-muramoylpentapeptide beta-N-acetylglucosaminyltransferase [Pseudomonadales bacterium]